MVSGTTTLVATYNNNDYGQIGNDDSATSVREVTPSIMPDGVTFKCVSASSPNSWSYYSNQSCAFARNGDAYCQGYNDNGGLGVGTTEDVYKPTLVVGDNHYSQIVMTEYSTSGISSNGTLYSWGWGAIMV